MLKNTIIIILILALLYLYYQKRKPHLLTGHSSDPDYQQEVSETISDLRTQLSQALSLQTANELKITEQKQEIRTLQTTLRKLEESGPDRETSTELEDERDELKRENITLNQEITARGNQIRNKNKEVENKQKELERLKKAKDEKEVSLNKKLSEKNKELEDLKKKYSNQAQLLDTEQTENNKLQTENEQLQAKITELETERKDLLKTLPGEFPEADKTELVIKEHQEQLRKINTLFDEKAKDYPQIDFNGLYSLLENIADEQKKKKNSRGTNPNIQPNEEEGQEVNYSLADFINWIKQDEQVSQAFDKVDWDYYQKKPNWIQEFRNWNRLRLDRINLLQKWQQEKQEINHD